MKNNFVKSIYRKHLSAASSRCGMTRPQTNALLMKYDKMTEAGDCAKSYEALAETYCSQYSTEAPKAEIASVQRELERCCTSHPGINTDSTTRALEAIRRYNKNVATLDITFINDKGEEVHLNDETKESLKISPPKFMKKKNSVTQSECFASDIKVGPKTLHLEIEVIL